MGGSATVPNLSHLCILSFLSCSPLPQFLVLTHPVSHPALLIWITCLVESRWSRPSCKLGDFFLGASGKSGFTSLFDCCQGGPPELSLTSIAWWVSHSSCLCVFSHCHILMTDATSFWSLVLLHGRLLGLVFKTLPELPGIHNQGYR